MKFTLFFLLINFSKALNITKIEYQHKLDKNNFNNDVYESSLDLINWIDSNIEDKELKGKFKIKKNKLDQYSRIVYRYKIENVDNSLIKYRKSFTGKYQNDLIWKNENIYNISPLWYASSSFNSSFKIEDNIYCDNINRIDYSNYIHLLDNISQLNLTEDLDVYFPQFSKYYDLPKFTPFLIDIKYEWILDIETEYDGVNGKFTVQIPYRSFSEYNLNLPLDKIELSLKVKTENSNNIINTKKIMEKCFDLLKESKWIKSNSCSNSSIWHESNKYLLFFLLVYVFMNNF